MSLQIQSSVNLLYPPFLSQVNSAIEKAYDNGIICFVFETYRAPERQDLLYNQIPKVTDAHAWHSWHQYGLACDVIFGGPGKWSWNGPFEEMADIFQNQGLRWIGGKDPGHFEYDHQLSLTNAKKIALSSGILSVWNEIEHMKGKIH